MLRELAAADLPVRPGELFLGKYLMGEPVGAGGMGVVAAAEHVQLGQKVAVKFLPATLRENPMAIARFAREARAAAQIRSEHVVRVVDVSGPDSDICYMVMEFLEGSDLAEVLRTRGPVSAGEAVGYVLQACEAIAEAHGSGIVHRDLKPSNLFLTRRRDGSPLIKVLDFGISKVTVGGDGHAPDLTSTMTLMGSPTYMSPEQVRSTKNVDSRTDIWSLGVILHELVTGQPVYQAESAMGLLAMISADPPTRIRQVRPDLPESLESTILACLQKQPAERLQDVGALARRLRPLAPRWAAVSVDRIMATSLPASRPTPSDAKDREDQRGTTLPLSPAGTTTSAQLSGELLPVGGARRGSAERSPSNSTTKKETGDASVLGRRSSGRWVVGGVVGAAIAIGVAVLMVGRPSPNAPAPNAESPRPIEPSGVAAIRAVEKRDPAPALPPTPETRVALPPAPAPVADGHDGSAIGAHQEEAPRPRSPKHAGGALQSTSHSIRKAPFAGGSSQEAVESIGAPRTSKTPSTSPSPAAAPGTGKDPLDGRR